LKICPQSSDETYKTQILEKESMCQSETAPADILAAYTGGYYVKNTIELMAHVSNVKTGTSHHCFDSNNTEYALQHPGMQVTCLALKLGDQGWRPRFAQ
jgi:hypothetical protein